MKSYIIFTIYITTIVSLFINNFSIIDSILHILSFLLLLGIVRKDPFKDNSAKYLVLLGFWISVVFMPAFHLGLQSTLGATDLVEKDYDRTVSFGSRVMLCSTLAWYLFSSIRLFTSNNYYYSPKSIQPQKVDMIFVIAFFTSMFCYVTGLGKMGAEEIVLPFHLGGIINLSRKTLFPTLFAVYIENCILCNKKLPKKHFILFILWCVIEMITWLSKSIFVMNLLPVSFVLLMYYRPSFKSIIKVSSPILVFFMVCYPIIAGMRFAEKGGSFVDYVTNSINIANEQKEETGNHSPFIEPLNRTFMTCALYTKDYDYIEHDKLFDFSKVPILALYHGAAGYQTFVIDGYPPTANHSSGTSGLLDPLLHGGYGLCYIIIFVLFAFSHFVDEYAKKKRYSITILLLLMVYSFSYSKNISALYDGVGMSTVIAQIFTMCIAKKVNYHKYLKQI